MHRVLRLTAGFVIVSAALLFFPSNSFGKRMYEYLDKRYTIYGAIGFGYSDEKQTSNGDSHTFNGFTQMYNLGLHGYILHPKIAIFDTYGNLGISKNTSEPPEASTKFRVGEGGLTLRLFTGSYYPLFYTHHTLRINITPSNAEPYAIDSNYDGLHWFLSFPKKLLTIDLKAARQTSASRFLNVDETITTGDVWITKDFVSGNGKNGGNGSNGKSRSFLKLWTGYDYSRTDDKAHGQDFAFHSFTLGASKPLSKYLALTVEGNYRISPGADSFSIVDYLEYQKNIGISFRNLYAESEIGKPSNTKSLQNNLDIWQDFRKLDNRLIGSWALDLFYDRYAYPNNITAKDYGGNGDIYSEYLFNPYLTGFSTLASGYNETVIPDNKATYLNNYWNGGVIYTKIPHLSLVSDVGVSYTRVSQSRAGFFTDVSDGAAYSLHLGMSSDIIKNFFASLDYYYLTDTGTIPNVRHRAVARLEGFIRRDLVLRSRADWERNTHGRTGFSERALIDANLDYRPNYWLSVILGASYYNLKAGGNPSLILTRIYSDISFNLIRNLSFNLDAYRETENVSDKVTYSVSPSLVYLWRKVVITATYRFTKTDSNLIKYNDRIIYLTISRSFQNSFYRR